MTMQVQMTLRVPVEFKKRGKWFIAKCPALDVVTQGETLEIAKKNLGQALKLFLVSCLERGALDEVLRDCGFRPHLMALPRRAKQADAHQYYLNIPIPFLVNKEAESEPCHA